MRHLRVRPQGHPAGPLRACVLPWLQRAHGIMRKVPEAYHRAWTRLPLSLLSPLSWSTQEAVVTHRQLAEPAVGVYQKCRGKGCLRSICKARAVQQRGCLLDRKVVVSEQSFRQSSKAALMCWLGQQAFERRYVSGHHASLGPSLQSCFVRLSSST